jgi:hypothetical protein
MGTTTALKEHPILFSGAMVRAILDGRKTQTRRIIKPQPEVCHGCQSCEFQGNHFASPIKQRWQKGDRLWVRETWREAVSDDCDCYAYKADLSYKCNPPCPELESKLAINGGWKPSIFMPKDACRLRLEITDIRVEQLQSISEEDAIAEGIQSWKDGNFDRTVYKNYRKNEGEWLFLPYASFQSLWESINGVNSWNNNPWVWVIEFKQI